MLDAVHSASMPQHLVEMGLPAENIIKWPKNGIEYYYPPTLLDRVFGAGSEIVIEGDRISRNGMEYTKVELVEKIVSMLEATTPMNTVLDTLLLARLERK